MAKNRFKLILVIFFTIAYMLSALLWWTIALTRLQENDYNKEIEIVRLQQVLAENCVLKSKISDQNNAATKFNVIYNNQFISIDTNQLTRNLINAKLNFSINYVFNRQLNGLELRLLQKDDISVKLLQKLASKKRAWILEGMTMGFITILIGIAMFVYLDRVVRLNQQQNNFLLAVTHELKTPIAAAKLALQTATKRPNSEIVPKMVVMAQSNISRLSVLVEQILMATRFENKFTETQKVWIEFSDFLNGVIKNMELKIEDFQRLDIQIPSNLQFFADEQMLSTVIRNLVTNAIKYSEGQGKINIEIQINDNNFNLIFTDEGIGISEVEKKNIFKKFYRVGEEKTRTTPGSGLGLFLVKKITEIHGGKVTVENNLPKGSKFILAFSAKDSLLG
jgi:signal transduction histidine kinase